MSNYNYNSRVFEWKKRCFRLLAALILVIIYPAAEAQVRKYPADITPLIGQPTSVYLSDYMSPGSNLLSANIVFNDFNEASWDFKLRVKIESQGLRMETLPGYTPQEPIVVAPGVMRTFSGSDWEEYLNYNNLAISGISVSDLINSGGRLPEGMYSFCFQVLDYETGEALSEEICRVAHIKLLDPPRVNAPLCGISLDPKLTQHNFAWQLFDTPSPNAVASPQFQLTVWELTERGANMQTAVANGQALQIFQSDVLDQPTYNYGLSDPPLEIGKQYVYRVQAIDPGGKDKYKNQGYSEFCSFYYGWPIGGKIELIYPRDGGGFRRIDVPTVLWNAVDSQLPGQEVFYEVKIVPIHDGQTKEQAIETNEPWKIHTTLAGPTRYSRSYTLDKELEIMGKYAWQVKAYTGQLLVGASEVAYFNGPSLVEEFFVSIHRVEVDYLDGSNLRDLSGGGRIRLASGAPWTQVYFEHIQLMESGDFFVMTGGEFFHTPPKPVPVTLNPVVPENGNAYFDILKYRINREGIYVEGKIRWPLPIPALTNGVATVATDRFFANYNSFAINTWGAVSAGTRFDLLEPFDFALNINSSSNFYVNENNFRFVFNGTIELPESIKGTTGSGVLHFPYMEVDQLFYFQQDSLTNPSIAPLAKSGVEMLSKRYILDLSERESPAKFSSDPSWKGLYISDFDVRLNTSLDEKGQFDLTEIYTTAFTQTVSRETDAWITANGLNLRFDINFSEPVAMVFQSFPAHINRFKLDLDESQVVTSNSTFTGRFRIPVISNDEKFLFTVPVNNLGFDNGSLDNLINTRFTHNPGAGDQELHMTIKRAVLQGFEKITMTVDLDWPSLGIVLPDLRGFNAWGDYNIGFDNKNGTVPLIQRYNATLSGYPITIGVIGAGSNNGTYVIATTADAGLGDDVSGGEGVPTINVYSVVANQYVPLEADGAVVENPTQQISFENASASVAQSYDQLSQTLVANLLAEKERIVNEAEQMKNDLANSGGGEFHAPEDMVPSEDDTTDQPPPGQDGRFNSRQQEIIYEIARGFVEEMSRPLLDPIKHKTDSLSLTITNAVNGMVTEASVFVKTSVEEVVDVVANELIEALENDRVDVRTPIQAMADETVRAITEEITGSMRLAVSRNIIDPVNVLLKEQIAGRINKHITDNGTEMVYAAITGEGGNAEEALQNLINGTPDVMKAVVRDVMAFVSLDNMRSTVRATASEFVKNINMNSVANELRASAEEILIQAAAKEVGEELSALAEQYGADLGLGGFDIGGENPINFSGAANRLAEGDIKGVFAIDPVRVKLRTPVIDLDGFMKYTPEHPVYGDVWLGDIDMTIKVPKRFAFNAIYFNGRKDDIAYWFCQITPPESNNTPYEIGKPLPKTAKPIPESNWVDIGVAKIVGASGRLYHHMKETPGNGIVPDASMRYGAYMHFVFYDKMDKGKNLRLEVSGEINSSENGDYTIAFDGNLQMRSSKVEVMEIDKGAVVQGIVMIRYNSAEEHFLGYAKVVVNDPGKLCASASLLVDVKPGKWRVAIGTREDRIIFVPGCVGWSPTGWLDLNQNTAELGLGIQYSGGAKSPDIDLKLIEFNVEMQAGIAFGIQALVQYRPTFLLMQAGVWVDIWASLIANYKLPARSWKSITLVEIYIRGDLLIIFNPPPTAIKGSLDGTCKIIGFKIDFSAKIDKTIG